MTTRRLPKPLERGELRALYEACDRPEITATMTLLVETGLRSAEVLSITRETAAAWPKPGLIRRRHPQVSFRVIGKGPGSMHTEAGGKERVVMLTRPALLAAQVLLDHSSTNGRGAYLVPWSDRGLRYVLAELGKKAGVHLSPHRFRHTHATQLIEADVPIDVVADMLGHSKLDITRLYVLTSERAKVEALDRRRRWLRRRG